MNPLNTSLCRLAVLALVAASSVASAQEITKDTLPTGVWVGVLRSDNVNVAMQVKFDARSALVHFDPPIACNLGAKFQQVQADGAIYAFASASNGGKLCDNLAGSGVMSIVRASPTSLRLSFDEKSYNGQPRVRTWRAELEPNVP